MSTRSAIVLAVVAGPVLVHCGGQTLTIGSNDGGAMTSEGGPATTDSGASLPFGDDSSVLSEGGGPPPATVTVSACADEPPDAPETTGVGLTAVPPAECTAASGPAHAVASAADVTSLLVGDWLACGGQVFGLPIAAADGIELAADGSFRVLGETADGSLVPLDSIAGSDAGSGPAIRGTGTYDVVDGSATYGAGAYELRLHPLGGGIFSGQVVVNDTPRQLGYFAPNVSPQVFAHPGSWSPRAGVCSCAPAQGTQVGQDDAVALAAAMVGRWVWCGDEPLPTSPPPLPPAVPTLFDGPGMGIEFTSDGSWYQLDEDSTGTLTRGTGYSEHGTFQLTNSSVLGPALQAFYSPEPLTLVLQMPANLVFTKVVVTENPRALLLNTPRPNGSSGTVMENAVLFAAP